MSANMKVVIALLCVLNLSLIGFSIFLLKSNSDLKEKLADKATQEAFLYKEKCALQAEKIFHQLGYNENQQGGVFDILQSHYSPKHNTCFMTMQKTDLSTIPGTESITKFLVDAHEQREYAEYTWISDRGKKFWEVRPYVCKLIGTNGSERDCNSEAEYDAYVVRYMTE